MKERENMGGEVAIKEPAQKVIPITLDRLEAGTDDHEAFTSKASKKLPEGITNRMIYSDIIRIGWPALLESLLMQLTGMFDQIQVGGISAVALAGVGLANVPKFLIMTACMALNVGVTTMVARARGVKNRARANKAMCQGFLLTFFVGILITIGGWYLAEPMIRMMGSTDPETIAAGARYLQLVCLGNLPVALTMVATASLRAVGNSRISLVYNMIANVVNIFLNWVLINGIDVFGIDVPAMGIEGAAYATVIGQLVAFVLAMIVITKKGSYLHLTFKNGNFVPDGALISDIVKVGIPAMIEQVIMRVGMILFTRTISSLGTIEVATHTACMSILSLSFMYGMGIGVSTTSLCGQSLGKKRPDMAEAYSKRGQIIGFVGAIALGIMFALFGEQLVGLYNDTPEIIELGGKMLLLVAVVQPFQASQFILAGSMRGAGDTKAVAIITAVTALTVRPILAYVFAIVLDMGLGGAWLATVVDQLIRTFFVFRRYNSGKWKTTFKSRSEQNAAAAAE